MSQEIWLDSLETKTPQEGFELAIKLSRMGVKYTQPDMEVLKKDLTKSENTHHIKFLDF